jgi:hypothetical protein
MTTNTDDPFSDPGTTTRVPWADLKGHLLVIEPHSVETGVNTVHGLRDAVRADVHVIDSRPPVDYEDVLIFGLALLGQLKGQVGINPKTGKQTMVIGRLGQAEPRAGQNPAWRIETPTAADKQTGAEWLAKRTPPSVDPWSAPATSSGMGGEPPF